MTSEQCAGVRDTPLSESDVESAALSRLAATDWRIAHGPDIAPGTPDAERADHGNVVGVAPA